MLVGGTGGAQLLILLSAPFLTRLYAPEHFGLLAIYASLLAIVSVVVNLRYEIAIPLPPSKWVATNLAAVASLIAIAISLCSLLAVYLFEGWLSFALGAPELRLFLWMLPFAVLLTGFQQVLVGYSVREKQFKVLSGSRLCLGLVTVSIQLFAFKLEALGLLLGQVTGLLVSTLFLAVVLVRAEMIKAVSLARMLVVLRRFARFPKFSIWDGLSNTAGTQLPTVLVVSSFGASAGGLYSMTLRVLVFPVTLIGAAVGQVFLSDAPAAHREKRLAKMVLRLTEIMLGVSLPFVFVAFIFGPDVFALVFGDAWRQSGEFARWFSPWIILTFVYSPLSSVFSVLKLEKTIMQLQLVLLVLRLCVVGAGIALGDLLLTVILFGALNFFYYLFLICRVLGLFQISLSRFLVGKAIQMATLFMATISIWALTSKFGGNYYFQMFFFAASTLLILFYVKKTVSMVKVANG